MCQLVYSLGKMNANHYQKLLHPLTLKLIGEPFKVSLKGKKNMSLRRRNHELSVGIILIRHPSYLFYRISTTHSFLYIHYFITF